MLPARPAESQDHYSQPRRLSARCASKHAAGAAGRQSRLERQARTSCPPWVSCRASSAVTGFADHLSPALDGRPASRQKARVRFADILARSVLSRWRSLRSACGLRCRPCPPPFAVPPTGLRRKALSEAGSSPQAEIRPDLPAKTTVRLKRLAMKVNEVIKQNNRFSAAKHTKRQGNLGEIESRAQGRRSTLCWEVKNR